MPSYKTVKPENTSSTATANDLHITSYDPSLPPPAPPNPPRAKLNLRGLDGKAPGDPLASYELEGDGTDTIDISGINVGMGGEANLRIQADTDKFPKLWVHYTKDGGRITEPETFAAVRRPRNDDGLIAAAGGAKRGKRA